jgi:hypothetical protein
MRAPVFGTHEVRAGLDVESPVGGPDGENLNRAERGRRDTRQERPRAARVFCLENPGLRGRVCAARARRIADQPERVGGHGGLLPILSPVSTPLDSIERSPIENRRIAAVHRKCDRTASRERFPASAPITAPEDLAAGVERERVDGLAPTGSGRERASRAGSALTCRGPSGTAVPAHKNTAALGAEEDRSADGADGQSQADSFERARAPPRSGAVGSVRDRSRDSRREKERRERPHDGSTEAGARPSPRSAPSWEGRPIAPLSAG